jgi:hypothetical protein
VQKRSKYFKIYTILLINNLPRILFFQVIEDLTKFYHDCHTLGSDEYEPKWLNFAQSSLADRVRTATFPSDLRFQTL